MSERFPTERRLRKRREYLAVQASGSKVHSRSFVVLSAKRDSEEALGRLGITVSKRIGPAVVRNRIKRLVREFVRKDFSWLPAGRDVIVIARRPAAELDGLSAVSAELERLRGRLG